MISQIKRRLRKHKKIFSIVKKIYVFFYKAVNYPKQRAESRAAYEKVSLLEDSHNRRIWYLCVPLHPNIGDQAQAYCIRKWFMAYYPEAEVVELLSDAVNSNSFNLLGEMKKKIKPADLIFFQSGYTSIDTHRDEITHRIIAGKFKDNKIIFFPQTVRYTCELQKQITAGIYNGHAHLMFMARDRVSFETAANAFKNARVLAYPDIVTSLIGKYRFNNSREGILFCMRNDSEQLYEKTQIEGLRKRLSFVGPSDITDTTIKTSYRDLRANIEGILDSILDKFSRYKLVITDRYHGTIFALIANTPVIVIDSTDHKLSSGVDWFKGIYDEYVCFAKSLEEAYDLACVVMKREYEYCLQDYFDRNYYQKLYGLIEEGEL
ncbi:exopolysaccharide biosynthesis predicted pyruvyl transferase EpsI [Anaerobacterium chartisolvens]|uniref:Exopolysaccharide biosynthesis predicted pyruvyl transferase EpsI n=1 Tax=Anaerobacterium chartisolvens TaxID=1297424 RepID=A0A369BCK3_9FIRM|nr:polysaccharide pyruvyl transferase family protein [Anaerobacterium chartisolvens]RCX19270.1 exopolysaccharide biosynthesis predicted pyruvyl transferase EpsI [Anaerobacterium chartisolvens]